MTPNGSCYKCSNCGSHLRLQLNSNRAIGHKNEVL